MVTGYACVILAISFAFDSRGHCVSLWKFATLQQYFTAQELPEQSGGGGMTELFRAKKQNI